MVFVAEIILRNTEDSARSFHHQCCCLFLRIQSLAGWRCRKGQSHPNQLCYRSCDEGSVATVLLVIC